MSAESHRELIAGRITVEEYVEGVKREVDAQHGVPFPVAWRPTVRVDNTLLFPDGTCRKLTLRERFRWWWAQERPTLEETPSRKEQR